MKRRILFPLVAILAYVCVSGCNEANQALTAGPKPETDADQPPADIGGPLFAPAPFPKAPAHPGFSVEPMLVHSHLANKDEVNIPSSRDTKILFIGTEVMPGEVVIDPSKIYRHRNKMYRPLEPGNQVVRDQLVMILDDRQPFAELELRRAASQSGQEIYEKAVEMHRAQLEMYQAKQKLRTSGNLSDLEWFTAVVELKRSEATVTSSKADMIQKNQEFEKAKVDYDYYYVRSNIAGMIQPFKAKAGESIKALDTLMQIESTESLRADGEVPVSFARRLVAGMPVSIEPSREIAPVAARPFHTRAVNAVAISNHSSPFIISVGDDQTARVWNGHSDYETAIFTHKFAIHSVACSPPGSPQHYCITGAEDGKLRLWDLSNPVSSDKPLREFEGFTHKSVISALAFSPDGKMCASADSRDIALWDVESGKLKYRFPQVHLGEITSLTFTPQAKLVSASRDQTVRVWSVGENGASLDFTQEGRSGDVARLGVSNDGRYFLFDIAQGLRLMTIPDRRTEGWLEGSHDSSKFATFATFSNDNKTILTGMQSEGRLSVWRTPTAGVRATEICQFKPRDPTLTFTCAAIAPRNENPFAVTGTKSGEVFIWPMPAQRDLLPIKGTLNFVGQTASATHQVRIWADFDNRQSKLMPGDAVTIVIEPSTK